MSIAKHQMVVVFVLHAVLAMVFRYTLFRIPSEILEQRHPFELFANMTHVAVHLVYEERMSTVCSIVDCL